MRITKQELIKKIKESENPTIETLSKELKINRQYISVLLNSLEAEKTISYTKLGNNKIWKVEK